MKQVICIKWGTVYGPEYVNILWAMCRRNLTGEFTLICFTDDTTGIRSEVKCLPLPSLGCEIPKDVLTEVRPKVQVSRPMAFGRSAESFLVDRNLLRGGVVELPPIKLGARVAHASFGEGVVTNFEGAGASARVQINFADSGAKWLVLAYANLSML